MENIPAVTWLVTFWETMAGMYLERGDELESILDLE